MKKNKSINLPYPIGSKFVCQFSKTEFLFTNIQESEFSQILKQNEEICKIIYYKKRLQELNLNLQNYLGQVSHHFNLLIAKDESNKYNHDFASLDINRVFNNFVISFRALIEHSEKRIQKNYGIESSEYKELKKTFSFFYDNLFSYRLLVRLRNYIIHYNQPLYLEFKSNSKNKIELLPYLKKSDLLQNDEIKKKLQNDLVKYEERIPIEEIIKEISDFIGIFYPTIIRILSKSIYPNIESILEFQLKYTKGTQYKMDLGTLSSTKGDKFNFNFIQLEIIEARLLSEIIANS